MKFNLDHNESYQTELLTEINSLSEFELILYNDDYNTFDHVIDCLMKYCKHTSVQAEQCAWIVHTKGNCSVKEGTYSALEPLCTALCEQGLNAQIELV